MVIQCRNCGKSFNAKRSDAKFCSGRCRTGAYRGRKLESQYSIHGLSLIDFERYNVVCLLTSTAGHYIKELIRNYGVDTANFALLACIQIAYDNGIEEV